MAHALIGPPHTQHTRHSPVWSNLWIYNFTLFNKLDNWAGLPLQEYKNRRLTRYLQLFNAFMQTKAAEYASTAPCAIKIVTKTATEIPSRNSCSYYGFGWMTDDFLCLSQDTFASSSFVLFPARTPWRKQYRLMTRCLPPQSLLTNHIWRACSSQWKRNFC